MEYYYHRGRTNTLPYLIVPEQHTEGFTMQAYLGEEVSSGILVGGYDFTMKQKTTRTRTTALQKIIAQHPRMMIWEGEIQVSLSHQGEGVASCLVQKSVEALERQGGLHIETFTGEGELYIRPLLLKQGYQPVTSKRTRTNAVWKAY